MQLRFEWQETEGTVDVDCRVNADPVALGCPPIAVGFPACTAAVNFPHLGYRSMLGWVQLVRSTDNASGGTVFESDPFALFGDAPAPYCWYGTSPTLFDGPSRTLDAPLDWEAHSYLAVTPLDEVMAWQPRRVVLLAGFSWGFAVRNAAIALRSPEPIGAAEWNRDTPGLREQYPLWQFTDS